MITKNCSNLDTENQTFLSRQLVCLESDIV